jgi:hypothetical protein
MTDWVEKTKQEIKKYSEMSEDEKQERWNRLTLAHQDRVSKVYKHPPHASFRTYINTTQVQAVSAYIALKQFYLDHLYSYDLDAEQDEEGIMMFQDDDEDQTFYFQIYDAVHEESLSRANLIFAVADGACEGLVNKGEYAVQIVNPGYPLNGCIRYLGEEDVDVKVFYHEDHVALKAKEYVEKSLWFKRKE